MIIVSPAILLILAVMLFIIAKRAILGPFKFLNALSILVFMDAVDKCKVVKVDTLHFKVEPTTMGLFIFVLFVLLIQANILVELAKQKKEIKKSDSVVA